MAREDLIIGLLSELYDRQRPEVTSKNKVLQIFQTMRDTVTISDTLNFRVPDPYFSDTVTITDSLTVTSQSPNWIIGTSRIGECEVRP